MSGKDERERRDAQERGEKQGDADVLAKRREQKPEEADVRRGDSLGEVERAAQSKGKPHDRSRHDEERDEPHSPGGPAAKDSRDERAQEQQ